jgi:hypothetical protein
LFNALMSKIPNVTEQQSLLRAAFKRLVDEVGQKTLVEAGLNQTVASGIYHGKKGIGDETIEKLDKKWPTWRDEADNHPPPNKAANESTGDAFLDTLLYCYKGMSNEHKEALAMMANSLYSIDNPNDRMANPWSGAERRKSEKKLQMRSVVKKEKSKQ